MSFIDNIKNCIAGYDALNLSGFRLVSFDFRSAYFENVLGIINYTQEEITLGIKKGEIRVKGKDLYVKKYCVGDVVICGEIKSIEKV